MLFDNKVQQRLSMSRNKRLTKLKWRYFATRVGNRLAFSQYWNGIRQLRWTCFWFSTNSRLRV